MLLRAVGLSNAVARLLTVPVTEIDPTLLATDRRITVIPVIHAAG